ncbi:MAG: YqgE/AlgH family protein [Cytophagales bacterium]
MNINLYPDYNMPEVKKGSILISEPFLKDPNFDRSVILICEHNENGTFGLVLNRPIEVKLGEVLEDLEGNAKELLIGGPVQQNTLHFIHKLGNEIIDSIELANGIYWGGDFEQLKIKIISDSIDLDKIKFFIGYSGWDAGQLDREIEEKSWFVADLGDNSIFEADSTNMWKRVLEIMGGELKWLANSPSDPRLN